MAASVKVELSCEKCGGLCCANPPQLNNFSEIEKALSKNVEVFYNKEDQVGVFFFVVKAINKQCPFLDKDFKCSIYEDRFEACKDYKCKALGNKIDFTELISFSFLKNDGNQKDYKLIEATEENLKKVEELKKQFPNKLLKTDFEEIVKTNNEVYIKDLEDKLQYTIKKILS